MTSPDQLTLFTLQDVPSLNNSDFKIDAPLLKFRSQKKKSFQKNNNCSEETTLIWHPSLSKGAQPFIKWVGGKRKLLPNILKMAPIGYNRYLEPFLGGGAVALVLNCPTMLLNDSNVELITTYRTVRDHLDALCALLDAHRAAHCEDYFYEVRKLQVSILSDIEVAARFIYLNKTAYNGLYRVNKSGQFNAPFGQYKNPMLYERSSLEATSRVLRNAELTSLDYKDFLSEYVRAGDFIYLDPVYHPVSKYSDFKRYTAVQFREEDQRELAHVYNELVEHGAYPVLSNSYCDYTLELYAAHTIHIVEAARNINKDAKGRGLVREILVTPRR